MNQSPWLILILIATVVCNGNCRPREVNETNTYPVYRSVKQLKLEDPNRYEKPFKAKSDDDSIVYERIDVPYKKINAPEKLTLKNNSKTIIDYVPVALAVKKTNVKKWPSGQNGIETPDDLLLYNIYTNNVNPLTPDQVTTPGHHFTSPHVSHSKPSVFIIEKLTTRKPFYEYPDSLFSRPPQSHNQPLPPSPPPAIYHSTDRPIHTPASTTELFPVNQVFISNENYQSSESLPWGYVPPTQDSYPVFVETPPSPTPPYVETTTKKTKKTGCPNVSIIASNIISNTLNMNKEGCQDITIHMETIINNTNTGPSKPSNSGNHSVVSVQNEPTTQTGTFGIFNVLWSIISKFFSYTFSNPFFTAALAPFSAFLAGGVSLSNLVLPWLFPYMLWGERTFSKARVLSDTKFEYYSVDGSLHVVTPAAIIPKNTQLRFRIWEKGKKISKYK